MSESEFLSPMSPVSPLSHVSSPNPPLQIAGTRNWMGVMWNETRLSGMTIPGTHDSGTYNYHDPIDPIFDPLDPTTWVIRCQDDGIREQLNRGIRFLDIRVKVGLDPGFSSEGLRVVHDSIDVHLSFSGVLGDCIQFLQKFPTETILLSLKKDDDPDSGYEDANIKDVFMAKYASAYPQIWYRGGGLVPTLGDVRGKIVLLCRQQMDNAPFGIKLGSWENDAYDGETTEGNITVYYEDRYKGPDPQVKQKTVYDHLMKAQNAIRSSSSEALAKMLWLTFTSANISKDFPFPGVYPRGYALAINQLLERNIFGSPVGIVPMDFPTDNGIVMLIRSNGLRKPG